MELKGFEIQQTLHYQNPEKNPVMTFEILIHSEKHEYMDKRFFIIHIMKRNQLWYQNLTQTDIDKVNIQTAKYLFIQL